MSDRRRFRTAAIALIVLLAALAPATTLPATPGQHEAPSASIDGVPGIWSQVQGLWSALARWLAPYDSIRAADEEPPPDPDDPFGGGGAGGGPGGGTGINDPNGRTGT